MNTPSVNAGAGQWRDVVKRYSVTIENPGRTLKVEHRLGNLSVICQIYRVISETAAQFVGEPLLVGFKVTSDGPDASEVEFEGPTIPGRAHFIFLG
jgi:hypothetical protein